MAVPDPRHWLATEPGTRVYGIEDAADCWRVWIARHPTLDYGTFLELYPDGRVIRVTLRPEEGDDAMVVMPPRAVR